MKPAAIKNNKAYFILAFVLGGALLLAFWGGAESKAQTRTQVIRIGGDGSYLGIRMEDVTADNMARYRLDREAGAIVRSVEEGSPAAEARLQENDVVLEYAGIPVLSTTQLARLVGETPVGRTVDVAISRDGKKMNLAVKVGRRARGGVEIAPRALPFQDFRWEAPEARVFRFDGPGEGRGFGFALPDFEKPRLGVTLQELTDQMAEFLGVPGKKGVLVTSVVQGSPADGKLRAGDVITSADAKSVAGPDDLSRIIRGKDRGATLDLKVIRGKTEIGISVVLEDGPRRGYRV